MNCAMKASADISENIQIIPTVPPISEGLDQSLLPPLPPLGLISNIKPVILKKKGFQQKLFIQYNIDDYISYTAACATERLRQLDYFYMHSPQEQECSILNIPNDRINLHSKKSLLFLCGGGVGVRFSSDDLKFLEVISNQLSGLWRNLESFYKIQLDSSMKKFVLSETDIIGLDIHTIELENINKETIQSEENKLKSIIYFQRLCNDYLLRVKELQSAVKAKQELIASRGCDGNNIGNTHLLYLIIF